MTPEFRAFFCWEIFSKTHISLDIWPFVACAPKGADCHAAMHKTGDCRNRENRSEHKRGSKGKNAGAMSGVQSVVPFCLLTARSSPKPNLAGTQRRARGLRGLAERTNGSILKRNARGHESFVSMERFIRVRRRFLCAVMDFPTWRLVIMCKTAHRKMV